VYELLDQVHHLEVTRENVVAIIESINRPMVAASGRSLEPAKSYIVGMRNAASGQFAIYIYLYLTDSNDSLIYLHDPAEIPMDSYHEQELEALSFVESMGFMVDNVNFRSMSPEQQNHVLQTMPVFQADLKAWARARNGGEDELQQDEQDEQVEDGEPLDLSALEGEVLELKEVALETPVEAAKVIPPEGVAKIAKILASF